MSTSCRPSPSMVEAAKIRDVERRHAYVFDNGLSSPDFFDVDKRMQSEEFRLLMERIWGVDDVLEIGCFTGLNLIGLGRIGHSGRRVGVDFVSGAVEWARQHASGEIFCHGRVGPEESDYRYTQSFEAVICFDVLEHQLNVGSFLQCVSRALLRFSGRAFFLVPVGREYFDCGHVAFFPDAECLHNVLDYEFEVDELFELKTCRKLFASCRPRV